METIITRDDLRNNLNNIFVFGDNTIRKGRGGAAILRDEPNVYGFITKKFPDHEDSSYYRPEEYIPIYEDEMSKLKVEIENNPDKTYLISRLGGGIANKYNIWELVIEPSIKIDLLDYKNVEFLWED